MAGSTPQMKIMMEERKKIDFNVEEITNILDGGASKTATRRQVVEKIECDPILGYLSVLNKTSEEKYLDSLKRRLRLETIKAGFVGDEETVNHAIKITTSGKLGLSLHQIAFTPSVMNMGSPEQLKKWLTDDYSIIGVYAQTELGHGTNLRGLETTATYVPATQEFVVNSPQLSSMKWWPGDLGTAATHAIVMADLIIKGRRYGMHPFIVPVRDLDTHKPLPGITVGVIGYGFAGEHSDNGFMIMDNVRIPRENMLAGVSEVTSDGKYISKSDPRVFYSGMLNLRVNLVVGIAILPLQKACTIATRYSLVRLQGSIEPDGPEVPVMDYLTQQHKILPLLAASYAYHFAARRTTDFYKKAVTSMKNSGDFSDLPELHCISAGLKAYFTEKCLAGTDICRRACGGHGYLQASGFAFMYLNQMASVTYEGENTVMYLQCARYLIKCATAKTAGKTVKGFASYLNDAPTHQCPATSTQAFAHHSVLLQAFKHRANVMVRDSLDKIQQLKRSGYSGQGAWNAASVALVAMAKTHLDLYILKTFMDTLDGMRASFKAKEILGNLCSLWALNVINENIGGYLMDGYFDAKQANSVREAELELLGIVRKDALGLVDAFDFTDKTLQSCLGAYDGNVYERLYENAKQSPRNETEVHEEFYKLFRPHLHKGRDALEGIKSKL